MPRSSRHKSHKQSKHSSRDAREHSDSEEDVKTKDRSGKEEGSIRVSRDLGSSEKRKLPSGEDPSGHGNGDTSGEYIASKRRKEKADGMDRWNGGGDERGDGETVEKESKGESSRGETDKSSKSKALVDSKSKSGRRYDIGNEKQEENVGLATEKEENKSSSRVDSKRKLEKDHGQKEPLQYKSSKESKDKERVLEKERKLQDTKRDADVRPVDGEATKRQGSRSGDFAEERQGKRVRENTEWPVQDELRNPELEKELEKRIRKRRDGSSDKDKYLDVVKESDERRPSSRGERAKDGRYKDEKHKDGSYGDNRHKDDKYREDAERSSKHKYREDGDRDDRRRDDKYHDDGDKDNRRRDDKFREDGDRDDRYRDDKYREDSDRDHKHRDGKYHGDDSRDNKHREDKYHEDGDRDDRHRDPEDGNREGRNREEKNWDAIGRESRHRDGKQRDDGDRDKRFRDVKYREERSSRDRTSDKSDIRRSRDESSPAEPHVRKASNRDGSPIYDDRSTRYKDDKGRRRMGDKEDYIDLRSRSTKESETEKKYTGSGRVELASERGRSNSRNTDAEGTPNHSRQRRSPSSSSQVLKDHYRLSKQEESKYGDFAHEETGRRNLISSKESVGGAGVSEKASLSRSIELPIQNDDNYLGDLSSERRSKSDARSSPLLMVDKSPSSMNLDRRHLTRSDVRRSLDIEDSGPRSGGSKDARDYSGREGRGIRDVPMDTVAGDELPQADGDNLPVSSPYSRNSHLSGNSRSLLPHPPFRSGAESPLVFGSLEDDNRGKSNSRYRRIGDPNMGRLQGNAWRGVPNWPSPVANGFIPFQHGPPSIGFHPIMQQFPGPPPVFGVRPSMELNQSGVPYPVPDGDRFSGHGRPIGWRNPVDESCPPVMHGWDTNSAVFGEESHIYGRLDWDHNRTFTGARTWEMSGDGRKGQNSGMGMELSSAHKKVDLLVQGTGDDGVAIQSGLQTGIEQKQSSTQEERADVDQRSDDLEVDTTKVPETVSEGMCDISGKDAAFFPSLYLSKLDISGDLTQPELYSQCMSFMDLDKNVKSEEDGFKFLFVEDAKEATERTSNRTLGTSLFSAMNGSVYEKALTLYNKQSVLVWTNNRDKVPFSNLDKKPVLMLDQESGGEKAEKMLLDCDDQDTEGAVSTLNKERIEMYPAVTNQKIDEPILGDNKGTSEGLDEALTGVKVVESDPELKPEKLDSVAEKSPLPGHIEESNAQSPGTGGVVDRAGESKCNTSATDDEGQKLHGDEYGPMIFSNVSSEACEAVMPESGSVNLSRIHQSPESTR